MILILTSKLSMLTNTLLQVRVTCSAYPMFWFMIPYHSM